jgi:hypothetical protein
MLSWLRNAVIAAFVTALICGLFLPIYTDEVGWRLQERAGFDGVDKLFTQLCGPNTIARPPFWMMPARWYSALFNSLFADPLYVRISGIIYALVWTGMLLTVVHRSADGYRDRISLSTLAVALMCLGTMPLLLVWSRPEQPILLAYTGAILIVLAGREEATVTPKSRAWLRSAAIFLLALVAMSYHVKGVVTVPLFVVCLALASKGPKSLPPRITFGVVLAGAAVWAGHYWVQRFACPASANLQAIYFHNTGSAAVSVTSRSQILPIIRNALRNIGLLYFAGLPTPKIDPMSNWLPAARLTFAESIYWRIALRLIWAIALNAAFYSLLLSARRSLHERKLDGRAFLAVTLLLTALAWSATGFINEYEATFALPMMVFGVVLALSTHESETRFTRGTRVAAGGLAIIAMMSLTMTAALFGPLLANASLERGYIKAQPYSISVFGFAGLRRDIFVAAQKCGIEHPEARHTLLVDDLTYFPFMNSHMPDHVAGLYSQKYSHPDTPGYLRSIKSDGVIAACNGLPPAIRALAKNEGQFCCVAPFVKDTPKIQR